MLANALQAPEFLLSQQEASALAVSIANVQRHYPGFAATQQTLDWTALFVCLVTVYGPKTASYQLRKKRKAAEKQGAASPATAFLNNLNELQASAY